MSNFSHAKPIVLCVLDGWGIGEDSEDNAILKATTPNWDRMWQNHPKCQLEASGEAVGLPPAQMGNSEVGHMIMGSGRTFAQDLIRIDKAIERNSFSSNSELVDTLQAAQNKNGKCHVLSLVSDGGVHSHIRHLIKLLEIIIHNRIPTVLHLILDGRDVQPGTATKFIEELYKITARLPSISIGTIGGRYYAMDRDKRWDRIEIAYNAIACGIGNHAPDAITAINNSTEMGNTDEFVMPAIIGSYSGMNDGDCIIMTSFRPDRARQTMEALLTREFDGFNRRKKIIFSAALSFVEYSDLLNVYSKVMFPKFRMNNCLPEVLHINDKKQLKIAETEKYPHITYFFSGGSERKLASEDRILIESPKVPTYDIKPEMSAPELTDELLESINSGKYDFILVNFANPDMVGHTGNFTATVRAVEVVDVCLGKIEEALKPQSGVMIITSDHGNCEMMIHPETKAPCTSHSNNPVPFVIVGHSVGYNSIKLKNGGLRDIAPTILELMGIEIPSEMNGSSLVKNEEE